MKNIKLNLKIRTVLIFIACLAVLCSWISNLWTEFKDAIHYNNGPHESMLAPGEYAQVVVKDSETQVHVRRMTAKGMTPTGLTFGLAAGTSVVVTKDVRDIDDAYAEREVNVRIVDGPFRNIKILIHRENIRVKTLKHK